MKACKNAKNARHLGGRIIKKATCKDLSRQQRLFMCSKTAESMRWHSLGGNQDGLMRHPRDYVDDELDKGWSTIIHLKPRDDMGEEGENEVLENEFPMQDLDQFFGDVNDLILCSFTEKRELGVN
ncbi:hypothetical protein KY284_035693 [Solanum tuberosum]|nr:hypothetical protein KY284_035693 [Solanum tuberosum]